MSVCEFMTRFSHRWVLEGMPASSHGAGETTKHYHHGATKVSPTRDAQCMLV
jgi:hypothetical protein